MKRYQNEGSTVSAGTTPAYGGIAWGSLGVLMAGGFYAIVKLTAWPPLERYFLGHPVAVAATILFSIAVAVLIGKFIQTTVQWNALSSIRDEDLMPAHLHGSTTARWLESHDAGHVARSWLTQLRELPLQTRASHLVRRLEEILTRQSQRGTTKQLSDDLRELSGRDADVAYDSLGLVRIIVWAIPMLGFLGTVIGITQTLGGLDFTDGAAAVDRLKSGLYVAFDTTALGLVLSVVAIFLQFPMERTEQRLLSAIDARIGHLVSSALPSDEASDNQVSLIAELCEGIRVAVAESIESQATVWRQTIDEARNHWQSVHESDTNKIVEAFEDTLKPALRDHAVSLEQSSLRAGDRWEQQWEQWQESMAEHAAVLTTHQASLVDQYTALAETHTRAGELVAMQHSIDSSLQQLSETNAAIDRSITASAGDGMADAMRVLARAVDVLSHRLPTIVKMHQAADLSAPSIDDSITTVSNGGASNTSRRAA
ncbi:MotA/TolQ/ExbB proton channel family protein [Novipirellula artificiosorum]|uniref:MotA/TolQ/ExbB proton channel family protein n=1 Tax=Novipirellula artificiosorum TaxID=2528016 RepID=A0A5C6E3X6_9BACT|nr:MotA/TolQ/ExbB proton channel family protein [Novipirellula artificiosorum]TWU42291.1 MotA/TolQ/ExbB proton channel family protein [Novipirellula artificiosorum]